MADPHSSLKVHQLSWVLVFAIVYADIGTSVFYTPGILYGSIGNLATLAQFITTGIFISIALKYVEICDRCPDGGGVVSIVRQAFSAFEFLPLVGGSFITISYFLTSAISGVSGLYYLASLSPDLKNLVIPTAMILFLVLILINMVGIKESASVASTFAMVEMGVIFTLMGIAFLHLTFDPRLHWSGLWHSVTHPGIPLTFGSIMVGYATTWLAYSGLESVAQLSGNIQLPIKSTASKAMWWVIGIVTVITSPITAQAFYILSDDVKRDNADSLLSALGFNLGGPLLGVSVVAAASALLFMACNTAIVGNYHVNLRLSDLGFLPSFLRKRHPKLGTPYISILISGLVPMAIILITQANVSLLGDLYSFGLLGTLSLSSIAVDRLRWQDGERGFKFWSGVFTTLALLVALFINVFQKPFTLIFGGTLALILIAGGLWHRVGADRKADSRFSEAEANAADLPEASNILTLEEAVEAAAMESSPIIVALRYVNEKLLEDAAIHAKGMKRHNVYVTYIDEMPGLFLPQEVKPTPDAVKVLTGSCAILEKQGVTCIPIWRMAEDAGHSLAEAARLLKVTRVFVGSSKRTFFWRMVKGRMLKNLAQELPESAQLVIVG